MKKEKTKLVKLVMDMYRLEVKDINVNVKYSDNLVQYIGELEGKKKDGKEVFKLFMDLEDLEEKAKDGNHDHDGHQSDLGVTSKKTSIFVDIVHVGGREVNPMSKNLNEIIF